MLAGLSPPPDKIVLVVPFDNLKRVAANYVSTSSANVVMRSTWNNVAALSEFRGPVDIYAAEDDEVIPVSHAKNLASRVPTATLYLIEGGHNDWLRKGEVRIRNP